MAKSEVAKAQTTELDMSAEFESFAGAGLETVGKDDILIPRLTLLQALSPQLNKRKPEYIEGAGIGDICDVGTGDRFEGEIIFLPVQFQKVWIEWAPRDTGKGLVEIRTDPSRIRDCTANEKNQPITPEGNYVQETAQFFGFNMSADNRPCFVSFASTQLKKSRKLNTLATSEKVQRADGSTFTPPLFYRTYKLGSAEESNSSGEWAGWTVERGPKLSEHPNWKHMLNDAVAFRKQIVEGEVKADNAEDGDVVEGTATAM